MEDGTPYHLEKVAIRNVKGWGDTIKKNTIHLNMQPNKLNILTGPNGIGKSSFATAFNCLKKEGLKVDKKDAYLEDRDKYKPQMTLTLKEDKRGGKTYNYVANEKVNEIGENFDVFVINSKPDDANQSRYKVEIIKNIPEEITLENDFIEYHNLRHGVGMVFPDISMYLNNENIMKGLILERYRLTPRQELIIKDFMRSLNELRRRPINGGAIVTKLEIRNFISEVWINKLIRIGAIKKAIRTMRGRSNSVTSLMKAIQWVDIMNRQEENVKKKVAYCQYNAKKEDTADLFAHLNKTWKDIQPEEKDGELVLEIKDSYNISNGERDTLLFIGNLEAVKYAMGNKDTILIIDEVFDYMDDANIVAAQYYIQRFLDRMKGHAYLFPIILTHNDPEKFFRYNHQKDLKISYFDHPACEVLNDDIKKMINKRQIWLEDEKLPSDLKDALDDTNKYLFHFHPNVDDKTEIPEMKVFSKVKKFKDLCKTQLDNYLKNQMNRNNQKPAYDPLAICFALREMVEKYLYDRLQTDEQKTRFLNETEGTHDKIRIAQEANVKPIPLIFEFLSMIYNEPLHVKDEVNKKLTDAHKRLFSRLHNRTIQLMIKEVKDLSDAPIDEN